MVTDSYKAVECVIHIPHLYSISICADQEVVCQVVGIAGYTTVRGYPARFSVKIIVDERCDVAVTICDCSLIIVAVIGKACAGTGWIGKAGKSVQLIVAIGCGFAQLISFADEVVHRIVVKLFKTSI